MESAVLSFEERKEAGRMLMEKEDMQRAGGIDERKKDR